ncbi:MAG: hypothetical protein V4487_00825 [Chlamydiota bacterium]
MEIIRHLVGSAGMKAVYYKELVINRWEVVRGAVSFAFETEADMKSAMEALKKVWFFGAPKSTFVPEGAGKFVFSLLVPHGNGSVRGDGEKLVEKIWDKIVMPAWAYKNVPFYKNPESLAPPPIDKVEEKKSSEQSAQRKLDSLFIPESLYWD